MPKDGTLLSHERIEGTAVFTIRYQSNGHIVNGFLAMPKDADGKKLPCIIFNRGGSGDFGAISTEMAIRSLGGMASWGYVVIASQYSGNAGSEGKDDLGGEITLNDVLNLKKVLGQIKEADTSRIGMFGVSRGGMMTYRALAKVKWIKAAVTVAGLADLKQQLRDRPDMMKTYAQFGLKKNDFKSRSAVEWSEKFYKKAPILMMHGTADWRVSVKESLALSAKLFEAKVPHRLVVFEGGDHGLTEHREERRRLTREWLDRYVRDGVALPNLKLHGE